jgi:pimeloyl-ACP methyl ester carboxylesterase
MTFKIAQRIVAISPDVRLHYLEAGEGAPVVVLLHGFPQTSHAWRKLVPRLTDAGFRAIEQITRGPDGCPARRSSTDQSRSLLRIQTRAGPDRGETTSLWAAKRR